MAVRAKFYVSSITKSKMGQMGEVGHAIKLNPVTSGSEENAQFYRHTPGGEIQLSTVNDEAAKQFEIGKEFYIDFVAA